MFREVAAILPPTRRISVERILNKALKSKIFLKHGTQDNFANKVDERPSVVSKVVNGKRKISIEKKRRWARALGCEVSEVFNEKRFEKNNVPTVD